ncbi:MAG: DNA topoisomerase VI subunit B [Nanobdellota archaeon]
MTENQETLGEDKVHASELAKKHKEIGVAEFFAKNRHLLGFDNKVKALMTTIKEAVDNALDACEDARILPEISVEVTDLGKDKYRIVIEDNGPGIMKKSMGKIFAKLLYGSKFHKLGQSRGQQGIGISACVMYGQMTTGKPAVVTTKTGKTEQAYKAYIKLNTKTNQPDISNEEKIDWTKDHGTRIELDMEASYQKGNRSIDEYLKQTAITNPHATIIYMNPKGEQIIFPRVSETLPPTAKEIKPHPYGVELGFLMDMLKSTQAKTLQSFLTTEFSRVSASVAKSICENSALLPNTKPSKIGRENAEKLLEGINKTKIMSPPSDCLSPIGGEMLEKGLKKEINAEFYASTTRPPNVYRGNPFVVEAALAYGGEQQGDNPINIMRFANRVPLLYQQGACAVTKSVINTSWKNYSLQQSSGNLPIGPCTIAVHIASVWVPFTSESKESIAHYEEIIKEMKLAVQEVGRKLGSYIGKKKRVGVELKKRNYIEKFIPYVSESLIELLGLDKNKEDELKDKLKHVLEQERGKIKDMKFDPNENTEYDKEFANIGKEEEKDE